MGGAGSGGEQGWDAGSAQLDPGGRLAGPAEGAQLISIDRQLLGLDRDVRERRARSGDDELEPVAGGRAVSLWLN